MKKFTLLFMSMFLVLGTVMAQKDEGNNESVEFRLASVTPENGGNATSVDRIQMVFTKDVNVTLPAEGIAVTNTATNEVVKITRLFENPLMPKYYVIFQFEQKKQYDEKEGKENLVEQYITTPGNYTYTIPAGCIKSVDGEEFAEQTFTFSIVNTFPVSNYTPIETDKLENIVLTFDKEITKVNASGLYVVDYFSWSPVANVKNATIGEDKKTVTLELDAPITTLGAYVLEIHQGVFETADAINSYSNLNFNLINTKPSFSTNYQNGDTVNEIGDLEITFKNVTDFEWTDDAEVELYTPTGADPIKGKISKSEDGTKLIASFEGYFPEAEGYVYFISAGSFTMDGVANEVVEIEVNLSRLVITPLEVVSVSPEVGTVGQLERIVIKFNQKVCLAVKDWQQISREIKLTCGDQEHTLTYNSDIVNVTADVEYLANAVYVNNQWKTTPITAEGTYTLNLGDIVLDYAATDNGDGSMTWNATGSVEGTYTWTISEGAGIKAVDTEDSEQVIYDLLGRRVEKIAGAGIYIVNGKKVIVK